MTIPQKIKDISLLCAILILGFALRAYNANFQSIGFHNMQENEFIGLAHNMQNDRSYAAAKTYYHDSFNDGAAANRRLQPPLVSYQTLLAWKAFGENVWGPRLINIIFGAGSILLVYFIAALLLGNRNIALLAALEMAIMPLGVFFSRNLQPDSPAFFFMLLGTLFYLRFAKGGMRHNLALGGVFFSAAWFYKFNFLIGLLPILFVLPSGLKKEKRWFPALDAILFVAPYLAIASYLYLSYRWGIFRPDGLVPDKLPSAFTLSYWREAGQVIFTYMTRDNFTPAMLASAAAGMILAAKRRDGPAARYIAGWIPAIALYCVLFSLPMSQNSYCQMPMAGLVCLASAYAACAIGAFLKRYVRIDIAAPILAAVILLSVMPARESITRMHSTVFIGVDAAGESLRSFTKPGDRVFLLTHPQGSGIARYAQRHTGWTNDVAEFMEKEKEFGINYICFYPSDYLASLKTGNPELFRYIESNYHLKELGMTEEPRRVYYMILEKGAKKDPEDLLGAFSGNMQLKVIYRIPGSLIFFNIMRPESGEKE